MSVELFPVGAAGLNEPVTPAGAPPRLSVTAPVEIGAGEGNHGVAVGALDDRERRWRERQCVIRHHCGAPAAIAATGYSKAGYQNQATAPPVLRDSGEERE